MLPPPKDLKRPDPGSERIQKAKAGQKIKSNKGENITILPACSDKNGGNWRCITHGESFENQLQKDFHIHSGTHLLAWNCHTHGLEEP